MRRNESPTSPATIKNSLLERDLDEMDWMKVGGLAMREARWAHIVDWRLCSSAAIDKKHS